MKTKLNEEQKELVRKLYWIGFNEGISMTYEDYCSQEESTDYLREHNKSEIEQKLGLDDG